MMMYTAIIGIGIPGSGKTTYLEQLALRPKASYVCADDIRCELTGKMTDHSRERDVWDLLYARIDIALLEGDDIIIDVTNANGEHRRKLIEHCKTNARMIIGIWFDIPADICKIRNRSRSRIVPDRAIDKMASQLINDPPTKNEGFDMLCHRKF